MITSYMAIWDLLAVVELLISNAEFSAVIISVMTFVASLSPVRFICSCYYFAFQESETERIEDLNYYHSLASCEEARDLLIKGEIQ